MLKCKFFVSVRKAIAHFRFDDGARCNPNSIFIQFKIGLVWLYFTFGYRKWNNGVYRLN